VTINTIVKTYRLNCYNNFKDWTKFSIKGEQFLQPLVKYYPHICLKLLRKTTENFSQDSWHPG